MTSASLQSGSNASGRETHSGSKEQIQTKNEPVTNETVERKHRKRKLVKKQTAGSNLKYYAWISGHALSIAFGIVYLTGQVLWLPSKYYINSISYRISLIGSAMALTATMSKKYGLHFLPPFSTLLAQKNFQCLVLALIWCFTFKSVLKVIPSILVSVLQLSLHKKIDVVLEQSDVLGTIIAFDELTLIAYLLLRTLLFRSTSGYQLLIMLVFMWLRVLFDKDTASLLGYVAEKADSRVSAVKNEKVQDIWREIKDFLAQKQKYGAFTKDHNH